MKPDKSALRNFYSISEHVYTKLINII